MPGVQLWRKEKGNKVTERQGLIDLTGEVDDSSVAASKAFANQELMVIEYI